MYMYNLIIIVKLHIDVSQIQAVGTPLYFYIFLNTGNTKFAHPRKNLSSTMTLKKFKIERYLTVELAGHFKAAIANNRRI